MGKESIGLELRSLFNLIRRYFDFSSHKREIEKVTCNNGRIIGYLADNEEQDIYQKDIEDHFTITRATASKVLSLMEKKELIQRQAVEKDARLKKIVLTKKALGIREVMLEDEKKMERNLIKGFTREEIEILLSYITRMKQNLSNSRDNH